MTGPILIEVSTGYRTLINRALVGALKAVFTNSYKDPLLANLKVTTKYPLTTVDYPALVFEYEGKGIYNMGVGHEEWFDDAQGVLRKWHHRRFEGTATFNLYALSPLDRDILADALVEVLSFGRLDPALLPFFTTIYGDNSGPVNEQTMFNQLALNTDEIEEEAASATIAPWQPEDVLVYSISYSCNLHGGIYNTVPSAYYPKVITVKTENYPQFNVNVDGTFETVPPNDQYPNAEWTNPFDYQDNSVKAQGVAFITGAEIYHQSMLFDLALVAGVGNPSSAEFHDTYDLTGIVTGVAMAFSLSEFASIGDGSTVSGIGLVSSSSFPDVIYVAEAATISGVAVISGQDLFAGVDAGTVSGIAIVSNSFSPDVLYVAEATTISGVAVISMDESQYFTLTTTGAQ